MAQLKQESSTAGTMDISKVGSIKISSRILGCWCDQPRLRFIQYDAILVPQKLSDEAKLNLVITKLLKEIIFQVSEILFKPPEVNKYITLKDRLLKVYEESNITNFQKLLSEIELGNQKPLQLLRRMQKLARDKIPDKTLRNMSIITFHLKYEGYL